MTSGRLGGGSSGLRATEADSVPESTLIDRRVKLFLMRRGRCAVRKLKRTMSISSRRPSSQISLLLAAEKHTAFQIMLT